MHRPLPAGLDRSHRPGFCRNRDSFLGHRPQTMHGTFPVFPRCIPPPGLGITSPCGLFLFFCVQNPIVKLGYETAVPGSRAVDRNTFLHETKQSDNWCPEFSLRTGFRRPAEVIPQNDRPLRRPCSLSACRTPDRPERDHPAWGRSTLETGNTRNLSMTAHGLSHERDQDRASGCDAA